MILAQARVRLGRVVMTGDQHSGGWFWGAFSRWTLWAALITLVADQVSKWWIIAHYNLEERGRVVVLPFLDLVFVKNTGVSYSMLDMAHPAWQATLAAFAAVASIALWIWSARSTGSAVLALSLGLIIGGAIGNGIDRLVIGGVADFVSLHAFGFYWYVFNVADVAIVAGVIGLLYDFWATSRKDAAKTS